MLTSGITSHDPMTDLLGAMEPNTRLLIEDFMKQEREAISKGFAEWRQWVAVSPSIVTTGSNEAISTSSTCIVDSTLARSPTATYSSFNIVLSNNETATPATCSVKCPNPGINIVKAIPVHSASAEVALDSSEAAVEFMALAAVPSNIDIDTSTTCSMKFQNHNINIIEAAPTHTITEEVVLNSDWATVEPTGITAVANDIDIDSPATCSMICLGCSSDAVATAATYAEGSISGPDCGSCVLMSMTVCHQEVPLHHLCQPAVGAASYLTAKHHRHGCWVACLLDGCSCAMDKL